MCHGSRALSQPLFYCSYTEFASCTVVKRLFCWNHLAVEEAETNSGAVNHSPVVLHIDAALLPAAGRVIGRIPFYVFYCLQIFMGHFLAKTMLQYQQS